MPTLSALFPSLLDEILFWVVFVWVVGVGHFLAILRAGGERQPVRKKATEPLVAMLSLFLFGIMVIPILVGYARLGVLPSYLFYPGLVIMIVGFAIYYWAVLTLGPFCSGFLRVIPDHKVIRNGPYRLVRHPVYGGEILDCRARRRLRSVHEKREAYYPSYPVTTSKDRFLPSHPLRVLSE